MKRMGRKNREYYRICATDRRSPRDGRVIEELGTYDPHVPDTDARCTLNGPRVDYWISVGAQPSDAVRVLIKKYGTNGTHITQMEAANAARDQRMMSMIQMMMQSMTSPRRIVRGPDGRAMGVEMGTMQ